MITKYADFLKRHAPSWLYKLAAQSWIDYKFPRHLYIEVNQFCNLQCEFCPREQLSNHMEYSLFQKIIDESSLYGPRSFSLHLFGEPFFWPHLFEGIRYIKERNRKNTILLTTNGTLIERGNNLKKLLESPVDQVLWSWRKEAKFSEETKERLRKWGKFRVRFIEEVTPPEAYKEWGNWPNQEGRPLHNYGGNVQLAKFQSLKSQTKTSMEEIRWACHHLWLAPAVAWNGNFLLCCADPHQKEVLGNVKETPIARLWQSERLNALREGQLAGQYGGICKDCDVWKAYPNLWFKFQKKTLKK